MAEALSTIAGSIPALVLLDLWLPDGDGLEVVRRVREEPSTRDVPIVAVSARATPAEVERALAVGCDAHLAKPVGGRELLGWLPELLRR